MPSPLPRRLAEDIRELIASGRFEAGEHLATQPLAERFGVSRSPVREALRLLAQSRLLEQRANRGFFVRSPGSASRPPGAVAPAERSDAYHRFAEDWLEDRIGNEVTEQALRLRYRLTKAKVTAMLMRAMHEGWVERKPGYGWRLLPVAKTPEAFEQLYRFRLLIEPAALLEPGFRIDQGVLSEQRRIQEALLAAPIHSLTADRLVLNGSLFHEQLIRMTGNPFFLSALVQANRMRRLLEYRAKVDRERLESQCTEHLRIVKVLEAGNVIEASYLMRQHLLGALRRKSRRL